MHDDSIRSWCRCCLAALAALVAVPEATLAQGVGGATPQWEEEVADISIRAMAGKVKSNVARTHFIRQGGACPNSSIECRRPGYLVAGDEVVVMLYEGAKPRYVRVLYRPSGAGAMASGMLASADLDVDESVKPVQAAALAGTWLARTRRDNEVSITLRPQGQELALSASADVVDGSGNPVRGAPQRSIDGRVRITSDPYVSLSQTAEGRCQMYLVPLGRYMLVHDEGGRCLGGGSALTATGLYLRASSGTGPGR